MQFKQFKVKFCLRSSKVIKPNSIKFLVDLKVPYYIQSKLTMIIVISLIFPYVHAILFSTNIIFLQKLVSRSTVQILHESQIPTNFTIQ